MLFVKSIAVIAAATLGFAAPLPDASRRVDIDALHRQGPGTVGDPIYHFGPVIDASENVVLNHISNTSAHPSATPVLQFGVAGDEALEVPSLRVLTRSESSAVSTSVQA
ncbi:uncharacterized protein C8Q71DRAFT_72136 [Rhodofomes roseus]|uniref:Uncharacterized protein n=1 Tax=Rhodofomes roseus TaxID=34475 RepID=A0A4Y9Z2G5_9APHY|nr:uncharacterized protein C8Q71DRAFT_72136 [Rhodofomes roseus]KAH9836214.1 hypothetical protein C8Q71DRAFT_72136 [Rhodofomes roseus]TFY68108.1 hypothetical protein EVJ58_g1205 [Rhodofomes roseus]